MQYCFRVEWPDKYAPNQGSTVELGFETLAEAQVSVQGLLRLTNGDDWSLQLAAECATWRALAVMAAAAAVVADLELCMCVAHTAKYFSRVVSGLGQSRRHRAVSNLTLGACPATAASSSVTTWPASAVVVVMAVVRAIVELRMCVAHAERCLSTWVDILLAALSCCGLSPCCSHMCCFHVQTHLHFSSSCLQTCFLHLCAELCTCVMRSAHQQQLPADMLPAPVCWAPRVCHRVCCMLLLCRSGMRP
jgi:hypothetical protein